MGLALGLALATESATLCASPDGGKRGGGVPGEVSDNRRGAVLESAARVSTTEGGRSSDEREGLVPSTCVSLRGVDLSPANERWRGQGSGICDGFPPSPPPPPVVAAAAAPAVASDAIYAKDPSLVILDPREGGFVGAKFLAGPYLPTSTRAGGGMIMPIALAPLPTLLWDIYAAVPVSRLAAELPALGL